MMQVSQIFLTDEKSKTMPPFLRNAVNTVQNAFKRCRHKIYDQRSLRMFIEQNFDKEVLDAYDTLVPYAYKADLGRLCVLYEIGGWYFDLPVVVLNGLDITDEIALIAFRDPSPHSEVAWCCSNAVIYSRPKNPAIEAAIGEIVKNVKNRYYGNSPLDPTGPNSFGRALALHGPDPRHKYGEVIELTPEKHIKNRAFVHPSGEIFAWAKPRHLGGRGLSGLGAKGTNNYIELWNSRRIYDDRVSPTHWKAEK